MLEAYDELAQNVSRSDVIIFGYIDIFKNDHPKIASSIVPHFLIFTKKRDNVPIEVSGADFDKLFDEILAVIEEVVKPGDHMPNP